MHAAVKFCALFKRRIWSQLSANKSEHWFWKTKEIEHKLQHLKQEDKEGKEILTLGLIIKGWTLFITTVYNLLKCKTKFYKNINGSNIIHAYSKKGLFT